MSGTSHASQKALTCLPKIEGLAYWVIMLRRLNKLGNNANNYFACISKKQREHRRFFEVGSGGPLTEGS